MDRYTLAERSDIVELYIENKKSIVRTQRAFRAKYPRRKAPGSKTIRANYSKFMSNGNLCDISPQVRQRKGRSAENIALVKKDVEEFPDLSLHCRSAKLGISFGTLQRILKHDLKLLAHKVNNREILLD